MNVISLVLLIISIAANLVGLWLIWRRLIKLEERVINLINELGSHVGEYIDAMNDEK